MLIFLSTIEHAHRGDEKEWRVLFLDKEEKGRDSRQLALSLNIFSRVFLGRGSPNPARPKSMQ